jgi:ABC-2 type transport system ATP-binding protein
MIVRKPTLPRNGGLAMIAEGITKTFPRGINNSEPVRALEMVSLDAHQGEILGLIGPNGAGKTTFLKILLDIVHPTSGNAWISGIPVTDPASRERIGYLPEHPSFAGSVSAVGLLRLCGTLHGIPINTLGGRIDELISLFEMTGWANKPVRHHSKGMLQRIGLAQTLIHAPQILLLDEPGDGLDPAGRKLLRDILLRFRASGKTIIISSHILSEIEHLTDRIAIIDHGVVVRVGKLHEIAPALGGYIITLCDGVDVGANILHKYPFRVDRHGQSTIHVSTKEELQDLLRILSEINIVPEKIEPREYTLEEAFFSIIGRSAT